MAEYIPSDEHEAAAAAILKWYRRAHRLHRQGMWSREQSQFVLFGLARTGKTTLVMRLLPELAAIGWDIQIVAFTNKARNILNRKITEAERDLGINIPYRATTIHGLIYNVMERLDEETGKLRLIEMLKDNSALAGADLLILDEASMVKHKYAEDMEIFRVPSLIIGDPMQLHPVKGRAAYARGRQPHFLLTERHHTHDKEILAFGDRLRAGLPMPGVGYDRGSVKVIREHQLTHAELLDADIILVGEHKTRHFYNRKVRQLKGYAADEVLHEGEPVICWEGSAAIDLTNPIRAIPSDVATGTSWSVIEAELLRLRGWNGHMHPVVKMILVSREEPEVGKPRQIIEVRVLSEYLHHGREDPAHIIWPELQKFALGYAITTHKAQADGYDKVIWFDEPIGTRRDYDWRYTAATRAAEKLIVVWKPQRRR
jgi:exodeoxyribonuclease V